MVHEEPEHPQKTMYGLTGQDICRERTERMAVGFIVGFGIFIWVDILIMRIVRVFKTARAEDQKEEKEDGDMLALRER